MSLHDRHVYEFGPFRLEPRERRLSCDGQDILLPQKAFDVLVMLVSRAGHLVARPLLGRSLSALSSGRCRVWAR